MGVWEGLGTEVGLVGVGVSGVCWEGLGVGVGMVGVGVLGVYWEGLGVGWGWMRMFSICFPSLSLPPDEDILCRNLFTTL